jgi:hypothetical protein
VLAVREATLARFGHSACVNEVDRSEQWKATAELLDTARCGLTDPDDMKLSLYRGFLDRNELDLAFVSLADVAEAQRAPRSVWERLLAAADSMQLVEGDAVHGATLRRVRQHLTVKDEWFELRALLNEWDPIGVYDPLTDFPPDEYDCMEGPLMSRLQRGDSVEQITEYLITELAEHFGLDPAPSCRDFAQRLVTWFHAQAD